MDEAADAARGRGGEHRQRAGDIALLEAGGVGRVDGAGDVDDGVGAVDQPLERVAARRGRPRPSRRRRAAAARGG